MGPPETFILETFKWKAPDIADMQNGGSASPGIAFAVVNTKQGRAGGAACRIPNDPNIAGIEGDLVQNTAQNTHNYNRCNPPPSHQCPLLLRNGAELRP